MCTCSWTGSIGAGFYERTGSYAASGTTASGRPACTRSERTGSPSRARRRVTHSWQTIRSDSSTCISSPTSGVRRQREQRTPPWVMPPTLCRRIVDASSRGIPPCSARGVSNLPHALCGLFRPICTTQVEGWRIFVIIRTIIGGERMERFAAGTLAGTGCFRCESCGFAIALHELDEVPVCPRCGCEDFKRSSIFGELSLVEPVGRQDEPQPDWLDEAREALVAGGDYLAYEDEERVRVVALQEGWTRIGRSMSAHIRFDDPTVSRRHALIHREEGVVRILDDRSLNGVFVNGERIDMRELDDGDAMLVGRYEIHFIRMVQEDYLPEPSGTFHAAFR